MNFGVFLNHNQNHYEKNIIIAGLLYAHVFMRN